MKTPSDSSEKHRKTIEEPRTSSGEKKHPRREPALRVRRIMVPIDFSENSKKALQYAVSFAQDYGASVFLIHVMEDRLVDGPLLRREKKELEALAKREVGGRVPVTTLLTTGEPIREIIEEAKVALVDLLLISTHSRADIPDSGLGSVAEQIVHSAPCPVLVVRELEHDFLTT